MEKVIVTLRAIGSPEPWCARLRGAVAQALLDLGLPGQHLSHRRNRRRAGDDDA
jgi:hypothetical protein